MNRALLDDILFRYKHPRYQGKIVDVPPLCDANISCGDEINLYLSMRDGKIIDARYNGKFCSIANYGAELLLDKIIGLPINEAEKVTSPQLLSNQQAESLLQNPTRLKCFELAQRALQKYD